MSSGSDVTGEFDDAETAASEAGAAEAGAALETSETVEVDVAIVGAGGAGLSLVIAIESAARHAGVEPPTVVVVDPVHRREADRTWCWWADCDQPMACRSWTRMELVDARGAAREHQLRGLRYVMLRSPDFYAEADAALARLGSRARRITATAERLDDGPARAVLQVAGLRVAAHWVFDSRPARPARPGSTLLLQHFRGWTVRFDQPLLDPGLATLMDFRVPQPANGVAFAYCLPLERYRALVEYTQFSREVLPPAGYDRALREYLAQRWPGAGFVIEAIEDGVIPMTDAPFARRAGRRVFRIGTAGGATRPSTGYTFAAMQRQAAVIADLLLAGRTPIPPPAYPARHRWMDAVLLRAVDRGYVSAPDLFTGMFAGHPAERVVRFLDGLSSPRDELAVMRSAPMPAMVRASIEDAAARLRRRVRRAKRRPASPRPEQA